VRAPIQAWFIVALGLAMLAAAGLAWVERRWQVRYLGALAIAVLFADLWYWNSYANPIAYGHFSFDSAYGAGEDALQRHVASAVPPLTRFDGGRRPAVGPWDGSLDIRMEATVGYGALPIGRYAVYRSIMKHNPKLRDGLNVSLFMKADQSGVEPNPTVLPRVYFPQSIVDIGSGREAARALETEDPHLQSVALAPHPALQQDRAATATVIEYGEQFYRVRYHAASPSLLRFSVPYFPGWRATGDGKRLAIVQVDLALMGVVVPAGDHELQLSFRSSRFRIGAAITLTALILCALLIAAPDLARRAGRKPGSA